MNVQLPYEAVLNIFARETGEGKLSSEPDTMNSGLVKKSVKKKFHI